MMRAEARACGSRDLRSESSLSERFRRGAIRALFKVQWDTLVLRARGVSMAPLLRDGDRLLVRRAAPRLGDVVIYVRRGLMVCHRLVGFWRRHNQWYYLTRGDNQKGADRWVLPEHVLGVVAAWERDGRWVREGWAASLIRAFRSSGSYALSRLTQRGD